MGFGKHRSVRSLLAAAAGFAAGLTLLTASAQASDDFTVGLELASVESTIQRAGDLLAAGKPVHARALVVNLFQANGAGLSDRESARAYQILSNANIAIRGMNESQLSLEKAELALAQGDVTAARAQVEAILNSASSDARSMLRAEALSTRIEQRRAELAPLVPGRLSRAHEAFVSGDYGRAKAELTWVTRSDVTLSPQQQALVEAYQLRIVETEIARGELLDAPLTLSVQPGVVRREGELPPSQPAEAQPQAQPTAPPPPVDDVIAEANRKEAQRLLSEAMTAKTEQRYRDALDLLDRLDRDYRASLTAEEAARVASEINEVRLLQRRDLGPGAGPLEEVTRQRDLVRQETRAAFENLLQQADTESRQGNFARARELALQAKLRMQEQRSVFAEAEFQERIRSADDRVARIDRDERAASERAAAERERRERERLAALERDTMLDRERQIREALTRVRDLQRNQKYREALEIVESQILFLEPNNPAGLLLRDVLHDTAIFMAYHDAKRTKDRNMAELRLENYIASIPPLDIIAFPPDWPSLSHQRLGSASYADSPQDRALLARLNDQRLPSIEFRNRTLEQALGYIAETQSVNMDVDWDSLALIDITRDRPIDLTLRNITLANLLERILEKVSESGFGTDKATWTVRDGVLFIASDEKIRKHTILDIYDIRDLVVEIPDYTNAPEFDLNAVLQSGQGGGGQSPFQQREQDVDREPLQDRIDRMKDMIEQLIDPMGWENNGGTTGRIFDWQGQLVIKNTPANHREIRGLLSKLRQVKALQINVETRFLLVSQDWFEQIGFDLDVYFNADNNQVVAARGTDPTVLPSDFFDSNGRLKRAVTGGGTTPVTQATVPPDRTSVFGTISDSLGLAGVLMPTEGLASTILGRAPALGVTGQFLDDIQVDFLVQATQADRRTVSLTAPRLTFTNGQTSNIYVVRQVGFVSDLQPVVSDSAVGFDPTIEPVSEGVRMLVDGIVSADRRFVTMNIDAAIAEIEGIAREPVTAVAGGQLVSSAQTNAFVQIPTVTVTRVQTTVTVPDQGTILLGGQRLVNEVEVETGVPVLSKIPILNRFFSNRITSKEESTLLILLKPTVLVSGEEEERQFPGLAEQLNLGFGH
ncbi:MAG: hypothetical protein KF866_12600 [Phycisphaeraceae bacterium]|nr:hypothetical protein [Phycisphaeraceae bacterium]MCW5754096.1 hypothetical protein [Phycisphaeraceae bacterium]